MCRLPSPAVAAAAFSDLLEREAERLPHPKSQLGLALRKQRELLEEVGFSVRLAFQYGTVAREILREAAEGNYDLIAAGSAPYRAPLSRYMMGDITSELVERASCAVLALRSGSEEHAPFSLLRMIGDRSRRIRQLSDSSDK